MGVTFVAVLVEAFSVIVRRDSVRRAFKGNENTFELLVPNRTGCKDDYLHRIGFMSVADAQDFVLDVLAPNGLVWLHQKVAMDIAVTSQAGGVLDYVPWLDFGLIAVDEGDVTAVWLAGTDPGPLALPKGFSFAHWKQLTYHPTAPEPTQLRSNPSLAPGMREMLDPKTGKPVYFVEGIVQPMLPEPQALPEFLTKQIKLILERSEHNAKEVFRAYSRPDDPDAKARIAELRNSLEIDLPRVEFMAQTYPVHKLKAEFITGLVLMALDRYAEAEPSLRRAFALAPSSPDIVGELMISLASQRKHLEVAELGRRTLIHHPAHEVVVMNLAISLHALGEDDEAIEVIDTLLAVDPHHVTAKEIKRSILHWRKPRRNTLSNLSGREN